MSVFTSGAWRLGAIHVKAMETREVRGNPVGSKRSPVIGEAQAYQATLPSGERLEIGDIRWETRERDVRCLNNSRDASEALQRLRHGLRLSVNHLDINTLWVELSQARLDSDRGDNWSTLCRATMEELTEGAGISVRRMLERFGAEVDRREQLLGDAGPRRLYLCATFPSDHNHLPAICYVLTRVLPLTRGTKTA
jgi:hypothetical protein